MAARIGLIVPADFVLDAECAAFLPPGASLHVTRLRPVDLPYDVEHAVALGEPGPLREATETFGPIRPAAVAFGCTMASFIDGLAGEGLIRSAMAAGGAPFAITTSGALVEALRARRARRVGLMTPYPPRIAERFTAFMREAGFDVAAQTDRDLVDFERVVASSRDEVAALVDRVATPGVDVVFLAGTNTPSAELLGWLSSRAGRPVLSANQVTMWAAARAAGLATGGATTSPRRRSSQTRPGASGGVARLAMAPSQQTDEPGKRVAKNSGYRRSSVTIAPGVDDGPAARDAGVGDAERCSHLRRRRKLAIEAARGRAQVAERVPNLDHEHDLADIIECDDIDGAPRLGRAGVQLDEPLHAARAEHPQHELLPIEMSAIRGSLEGVGAEVQPERSLDRQRRSGPCVDRLPGALPELHPAPGRPRQPRALRCLCLRQPPAEPGRAKLTSEPKAQFLAEAASLDRELRALDAIHVLAMVAARPYAAITSDFTPSSRTRGGRPTARMWRIAGRSHDATYTSTRLVARPPAEAATRGVIVHATSTSTPSHKRA